MSYDNDMWAILCVLIYGQLLSTAAEMFIFCRYLLLACVLYSFFFTFPVFLKMLNNNLNNKMSQIGISFRIQLGLYILHLYSILFKFTVGNYNITSFVNGIRYCEIVVEIILKPSE